ncbi:MAG: acyl-CoA carboxylase subunit beta [Solirubrobacteraceae bacterium]|nr:acyl-CoA carboxylase subunit beta [Solirubrobacteraceae bacterium]
MSYLSMSDAIADLRDRREQSLRPGSERSIAKQHARGKMTARERVELLLDEGSFMEVGQLRRAIARTDDPNERRPFGDGVITGRGTIEGRPVCVFSQDYTVFGGSVGEVYAQKMVAIMELAAKTGCPIIGLADSGGARIQEGILALSNYAKVGVLNVNLSGVVPQISVIMGTCAGGAVYSPALTDFTFMVNGTSHMFVTGPEVVQEVTGQATTMEELGGASVNAEVGNCHLVEEDDASALAAVRELFSYLPLNNVDEPPRHAPDPYIDEIDDRALELDQIVPTEANKAYDVVEVIERVVDEDSFFQLHERWAKTIVIGFARIDGRSVGIIANQPSHNAGVMTYDSTEKAARFLRTCDAYNVPIVTFADVPGYMPGLEQERGGVIRRGAKLFYAYIEAKVPTVTVYLRKAYGGAFATMGCKQGDNDVNLAWPQGEIAVMGAPAAVKILHGQQLMKIIQEGGDVKAEYDRLIEEYKAEHLTPYPAAEHGWVDRVIAPHETRREIARGLRLMDGRRKDAPLRAHGNIPL